MVLMATTDLTWQISLGLVGAGCGATVFMVIAREFSRPNAPTDKAYVGAAACALLAGFLAFLTVGAAQESRQQLRAQTAREFRAEERSAQALADKAVKLAARAQVKVYNRVGHFTASTADLRAVDPTFNRFAARQERIEDGFTGDYATYRLRLGDSLNSVVITAGVVNDISASKTLIRPGKPAPQRGGRALKVAADGPAPKR